MATFEQVNKTRGFSITGHKEDPPGMSLPLDNCVELTDAEAASFMEWLHVTPWRKVLEVDLQSLVETAAGEPLLSTWISVEKCAELAEEAAAALGFDRLRRAVPEWREQGAIDVFFDFYESQDADKFRYVVDF